MTSIYISSQPSSTFTLLSDVSLTKMRETFVAAIEAIDSEYELRGMLSTPIDVMIVAIAPIPI